MTTADYLCTGNLIPDATGGFHEQGVHDGQPCYRRHPDGFWLWYDSVAVQWQITVDLGEAGAGTWENGNVNILTNPYVAAGDFAGNATIAAV